MTTGSTSGAAALLAVAGYIVIRGFLTIMVGGVWGQTTPHFPLYIVEALLVEAVFARAGGRSPVVNGAIAGALIGTVGLAAEWAWSHIWMPIPWNSRCCPRPRSPGLVTAVAAGAVGGFIGGALVGRSGVLISREDGRRLDSPTAGRARGRAGADGRDRLGAADVHTGPERAQVALRDIDRGEQRTVAATIRLEPRDSVEDPEFMNVTAWQGGGSVSTRSRRSARRLPDHQADPGLRRLEVDPAHPAGRRADLHAALHAARRGDPRAGGPGEAELHARVPVGHRGAPARAQGGRVPALTLIAYLTVLTIALALIALIAWSLLGRPGRGAALARRQDSARAGRTRVKEH